MMPRAELLPMPFTHAPLGIDIGKSDGKAPETATTQTPKTAAASTAAMIR